MICLSVVFICFLLSSVCKDSLMSLCWGHLFTYNSDIRLSLNTGDNKKHFNTIERQITMQDMSKRIKNYNIIYSFGPILHLNYFLFCFILHVPLKKFLVHKALLLFVLIICLYFLFGFAEPAGLYRSKQPELLL